MSDGLRITLNGMDDAIEQMKRIERGTRAMGRYKGAVYSRIPYAWGVEFGRHRKTGKLARRAGGAFYLTRAIAAMSSGADMDISEGLNKVKAPGGWVIRRLALWVRRLARANVPSGPKKKSHSYRLKRTIRYRVMRE